MILLTLYVIDMKRKKLFILVVIVVGLLGGAVITGYLGYKELNKQIPDIRSVMAMYGNSPGDAGLVEKVGAYYREWKYMKTVSPLLDLNGIASSNDTEVLKSGIDSLLTTPLYAPERVIWRMFLTTAFIRWEELDTMGCIAYVVTLHKTLPPAQFDEFRTSINSILPVGAMKCPEEVLTYYSTNQAEADKVFSINSTRMYAYLCQFLASKNPEKSWELAQTFPEEERPYMISCFIQGLEKDKVLEYLDKLDFGKLFGSSLEIQEYSLMRGIDYSSSETIENPVEEALVSFFTRDMEEKNLEWLRNQNEKIRRAILPEVLASMYKSYSAAISFKKDYDSGSLKIKGDTALFASLLSKTQDVLDEDMEYFIKEFKSSTLEEQKAAIYLIAETKNPGKTLLWLNENRHEVFFEPLMDEIFKEWLAKDLDNAERWLTNTTLSSDVLARLEAIFQEYQKQKIRNMPDNS